MGTSAAAAAGLLMPGASFGRSGEGRRISNPSRHVDWERWGVFKGNMHMHTLQSDGWYPLAEVVDMYKQAGYSILSITDHDWNYPNFRVDRDSELEYRRSPYPKDPKPANFPANPTWPWTDYGTPSPKALGMVGIQGNELTYLHHINSYFCDYGIFHGRPGEEIKPGESIGPSAPYTIFGPDGRQIYEDDQFCFTKSTNHSVRLLDQDLFPSLEQVKIDEGTSTITLSATDCDEIKWITSPDILEPLEDYRESNAPYDLGKVVHTGPDLDYRLPELRGYVRAELSRTDERGTHTLMTNPFGISEAT